MADENIKPAQPVKPAIKPATSGKSSRPLGVTIICILVLIGAILSLIGGASAFMFAGLMGAIMPGMEMLGMAAGAVSIIIGIIYFLCFWWLWKMMKKGYTFTMILSVISLIISIIGMNIIGVVLAIIILVYLYMKRGLFV
ncbi:MAG: hypothetical protein JW754_01185 [Candidatus Aenigmarchaeota archaeon]|nr:hypothetical protein [Candidatus Aenigmarchaeota archaeon]